MDKELKQAVVNYMMQYSGENYYKAPWAIDSTGMSFPLHLAEFGAKWLLEQLTQNASEVEVWNYFEGESDFRALPIWGIEKYEHLKDGDSVKFIILNEKFK